MRVVDQRHNHEDRYNIEIGALSLHICITFSLPLHPSTPPPVRGSYGELRLVFKTTDLPGGGVNGEWQEKLKDSIKLYINIK